MAKSLKSPVWEFFGKININKVRCKLCGGPPFTDLAFHGGTTSMRNHLSSKHPEQLEAASSSQRTLDSFFNTKKCSVEHAKEITERIAMFVARDLRPISVVDGDGFKSLMKYVEPGYRVPSHTHMSKVCHRLYEFEKENLKQDLKKASFFAFTTDTWTSNAVNGYITLTVHYIDDLWKMSTKVLLTGEMAESHTGKNIADRLTAAVEDWGIVDSQISAIVHDNAANANLGASLTGWQHFGCVAHTLQLCINSALDVPALQRVLSACRKLVGHFKHSVLGMAALKDKQTQLGIPVHHLMQDVATRWNSTYFMIERLCEQRVAIYAVLLDTTVAKGAYKHLDLKEDQWSLLSQMESALKPLQIATTVLGLEQNSSCAIIYPVINGLLTNHTAVKEDDLPAVKRFKTILTDELKRRFKPSCSDTALSIPMMSCIVDPRYSSLGFLDSAQRSLVRDNVVECIESLEADNTICDEGEEPLSKRPKRKSAMQFLLTGSMEDDQQQDTFSSLTVGDEVNKFMKLPDLHPDSDPLLWWKENGKHFPKMSLYARKLLCVPATSVPSERIFSVAGSIVTKRRANLKPESVDMLVFLNKNLSSIDI